ncbi:MAG: hypothetical protein AAF488_14745 [Planctomycetota bacterium]
MAQMIIIFRLWFFLLVGGLILLVMGLREYDLAVGASAESVAQKLEDLEKGEEATNVHVSIGEHIELYSSSIYEYRSADDDEAGLKPEDTISSMYIPILSKAHPEAQRVLDEAFSETPTAPKSFRVLVKAERFKSIDQIPANAAERGGVKGLILNRISPLDSQDRQIIRREFPGVDLDELLVLEEGRTPMAPSTAVGLVVGGGVLMILGLVVLVRRFFGSRERDSGYDEDDGQIPAEEPPPVPGQR